MSEYECLDCGNKDEFVETRNQTKVYLERSGETGWMNVRFVEHGKELVKVECYKCHSENIKID